MERVGEEQGAEGKCAARHRRRVRRRRLLPVAAATRDFVRFFWVRVRVLDFVFVEGRRAVNFHFHFSYYFRGV
jgi:hypothetical protein